MASGIRICIVLYQILLLTLIVGQCRSDGVNENDNNKWNIQNLRNEAMRSFKTAIIIANNIMNIIVPGNPNADEESFYSCLINHVEKLLPIVYTPVVGEVCLHYKQIKGDRGLMLRITEEDQLRNKLEEWKTKHPNTKAIVVTDGGRILGHGDLGANGMGIPIGKMIIYSALGGVHPDFCLPVTLDVGTSNVALRQNKELYVGLDRDRETGEHYEQFVDKFVTTAVEVFGKHTLIQFEDFQQENAFKFLRKYQKVHTVFNDDIQGTAAVALAGILAAERVSAKKLKDSKILFAGAGGAGVGIAELLAKYISESGGKTEEEARGQIFFKRSKKLIMEGDKFDADDNRKLFAKAFKKHIPEGSNIEDLVEIIKWLKPNILIGVSSQHGLFTKEVLEEMAKHAASPIIFALSNPLVKAECTAEEAYTHTQGRALFASGSPFGPVTYERGRTFYPRQCNNAYIFPGVALAITAAQMTTVPEEVFMMAAKTVNSKCTTTDDVNQGSLFPSLDRLRKCSIEIATEIGNYAFDKRISALEKRPENMRKFMIENQYTPNGVARTT